MVYITHNKADVSETDTLLHRMGVTKLNIDKVEIEQDISKLKEKKSNGLYKKHKKDIDKAIEYLERLKLKTSNNGEIELVWSVLNKGATSYPVKLCSIPELGVNMVDYIKLQEDEKMCIINYSDILRVMIADMMHRDLGYSTEDMENALAGVGITGVYPANKVLQSVVEDNLLELSNILKIGDTQYKSINTNRYKCYFNTDDDFEDIKTSYYRDIVNPSCRIVMSLLLNSVLNILHRSAVQYKLVSVNNSGICIIVSEKDVDKVPKEPAIIRAFGRLFEVTPNLTIF